MTTWEKMKTPEENRSLCKSEFVLRTRIRSCDWILLERALSAVVSRALSPVFRKIASDRDAFTGLPTGLRSELDRHGQGPGDPTSKPRGASLRTCPSRPGGRRGSAPGQATLAEHVRVTCRKGRVPLLQPPLNFLYGHRLRDDGLWGRGQRGQHAQHPLEFGAGRHDPEAKRRRRGPKTPQAPTPWPRASRTPRALGRSPRTCLLAVPGHKQPGLCGAPSRAGPMCRSLPTSFLVPRPPRAPRDPRLRVP